MEVEAADGVQEVEAPLELAASMRHGRTRIFRMYPGIVDGVILAWSRARRRRYVGSACLAESSNRPLHMASTHVDAHVCTHVYVCSRESELGLLNLGAPSDLVSSCNIGYDRSKRSGRRKSSIAIDDLVAAQVAHASLAEARPSPMAYLARLGHRRQHAWYTCVDSF